MLFELREVSLRRDGRAVLDGFSASLPEGASCVVGPSGSGKSTLLRLLNRLSDPERGTVRYRGEDLREREPRALRQEVALVPQLPALIAGTVTANLSFAAALAGREVDEGGLLRAAGLDPSYAERDAERLSVGEQQRVMLARALALQPSVLLLDEPTSALDGTARDAVEAMLSDLRDRLGLSIVLVTHDPEQAGRMADWVVRVESGRVRSQGPAEEELGR